MATKNPYQMYQTDTNAESEEGIELTYEEMFGFKVKRAGGSNRAYSERLSKKMKPYRRQIEMDVLPSGVADRIVAEAYAETVIIDTYIIDDGKKIYGKMYTLAGEVITKTKEDIVAVFLATTELFRDVQEQCNKISLFRKETLDADIKN